MIGTDTASRENCRPDGVTHRFQVSADFIEPIARLGNLFTKDRRRREFRDEPSPIRPEKTML